MSDTILEQREAEVHIGEYDDSLVVHFDYHEWFEGHPYGDTTAYERLSETSEHFYLLNGEDKSYEDLVKLYGEKLVDAAIKQAEDLAS